MDINDLKSTWQDAGKVDKTEQDLQKMLNSPVIKKIRVRLIIECVCFSLLLIIYYDWFDGHQKPLYANVTLVIAILSIIITNIIGYISSLHITTNLDIQASLSRLLSRTIRLSRFSLFFSVLYSIALITYFISAIHLTKEKNFLILGCIIILTQLILRSQKTWSRSIRNLRKQVADLAQTI